MSTLPDVQAFLDAHGAEVVAGIAARHGIDAAGCELLREQCVASEQEPGTVVVTVLHATGIYGAAVKVLLDGAPGETAYMRI